MFIKTWYTYTLGAIVLVAAAVSGYFIWTRRSKVRASLSNGSNKVRGTARSVWGRVETAASKLTHTERDPSEPIH